MSTIITGVVTNGVVVPNCVLPEGTHVEIQVRSNLPDAVSSAPNRLTPGELRKLPRGQRQAILAAVAELADPVYRNDKELTGFDAFTH